MVKIFCIFYFKCLLKFLMGIVNFFQAIRVGLEKGPIEGYEAEAKVWSVLSVAVESKKTERNFCRALGFSSSVLSVAVESKK